MVKETIRYTDYDGNIREEDFYFHYSKAEILDLELSREGGIKKFLEKIVKAQNVPAITKYFKKLVLDAYGEKSDDGRRFIKTQELKNNFAQTEAYSNFYLELATNATKASEFINALFPKEYMDAIRESWEKNAETNAKVVEAEGVSLPSLPTS